MSTQGKQKNYWAADGRPEPFICQSNTQNYNTCHNFLLKTGLRVFVQVLCYYISKYVPDSKKFVIKAAKLVLMADLVNNLSTGVAGSISARLVRKQSLFVGHKFTFFSQQFSQPDCILGFFYLDSKSNIFNELSEF